MYITKTIFLKPRQEDLFLRQMCLRHNKVANYLNQTQKGNNI